MIQFMDYHSHKEMELLEKLEPDFRVFHFEKNRTGEIITEEVLQENAGEIRYAYNFANKILDTGECEMLMLDGILECVEEGFLPESDVMALMEKCPENMDMILTGTGLTNGVAERANCIYQIVPEK